MYTPKMGVPEVELKRYCMKYGACLIVEKQLINAKIIIVINTATSSYAGSRAALVTPSHFNNNQIRQGLDNTVD